VGLITGILTLPLAPIRGTVWIADQIRQQAEEEFYDPARIRVQLEQIARARAEGELTQALGRLFALTEAYPELKANQNVLQLQEELASTENKVGFSRQFYNDVVTQYNTKQATFPTLLVAGLAKAQPAELWEIEDAAERAVPKVDLSLNKPQ